MKKLNLLIFLLVVANVFAQKFTLEGVVKDENGNGLEAATVYVQSITDSVPIAYSITNKEGGFSLKVNTETDTKAIFNIAYLGYKPYQKTFDIPTVDNLNLGFVILNNNVEELNVVSIIGKAPPIVIKKDTIEYNADSFKTMPNDKAEDLLKKLPGVEINTEGDITVNGVEVEAVNVDGKAFFGEKKGDIALKNIPSNVISKVQITDYKTDLQKFTGEESDSGTKEINLKIKKGKNRAYFGDVNLGYGTDKKYQANANVFQLVDGKQLGIIAGTNNINASRGFNALPEAESSNGYIESDFVGANYSKGKWDETQVNSNYRYSTQNRDNERTTYSENFLPNRNYITEGSSKSYNDSDSHNGNLDLKFVSKKGKDLFRRGRISNDISFSASNNDSYSESNSKSEYDNGDLVSQYTSKNQSSNSNYSINNNFRVTSVFGENRDYLNMGVRLGFNKNDGDGRIYSRNEFESDKEDEEQNQISNTNNSSNSVNVYGSFRKNISSRFSVIPEYNVTVSTDNNERYIYDYNEDTGTYDNFNSQISADSRYINTTIAPELRLRYEVKDWRFELGGTYTSTYRKFDDNILNERDFKNEFEYFTYSGRIRYRDEKGYKNISLNYRQNVNLPSMSQLQPVADVSNITNIRTGNPNLKPEVNHSLRFEYQRNLAYNNINLNANAGATFLKDKITNATLTDDDLVRYTTYDNIDGDYSFSGNVGISKSIYNKKNNFNINLNLNGDYRNIRSIQNAEMFTTKTGTLSPSVSLGYSYNEILTLNASYSYSLTNSEYNTNMFNDNDFFVQNLRFDSSLYFLKNLFLSNKLSYRYNSRVGDAFDGAAVLWNAGLGVQLWNEKATLSVIGYDILDQNNGFTRSVTESAIRDVENNILEQYFMVTFVYKFGRFAGQNINVGGRRGSGGRPPRPPRH
ncbi:MAG: TonB-dependent receptor domain-containing protein [Aestuariibaculum sp.]